MGKVSKIFKPKVPKVATDNSAALKQQEVKMVNETNDPDMEKQDNTGGNGTILSSVGSNLLSTGKKKTLLGG